MAKPRVFVSSTFYDLRHVRSEIERFISGMGYEPVLNERGNIAYENKEALEKYCYREIEKIHILVSIIGGRFGSASRENPNYSVSNIELKSAIDQGKQIYVFVERGVLAEYRTYVKNKEKPISYHHVDDVKIYQFLDKVYHLPVNNQIASFESVPEITTYLRQQWAGLFELYLQQQAQERAVQIADTIRSTAETLKELVELLRDEKQGLYKAFNGSKEALDAVLIQNHPVFGRLADLTSTNYRIFFTNLQEMNRWLKVRGYEQVEEFIAASDDDLEYIADGKKAKKFIYISKKLFDQDGRLRMMLPSEWSNNYVRIKAVAAATLDDDTPF